MKTVITSTLLALLSTVPAAPLDARTEVKPGYVTPPTLLVFVTYDKPPAECLTYHDGDHGWINITEVGTFDISETSDPKDMVGYHLNRPMQDGDTVQFATAGQTIINTGSRTLTKNPSPWRPNCNNHSKPATDFMLPIHDGATCGSLGWPMKCVIWNESVPVIMPHGIDKRTHVV